MKIQITNGMFMALIINLIYAKAIGLTQGSLAREVGGDMWISTIFSTVQGLIIMLLTVYIIKRMPDGDMIQQSERLLGKWFSKGVAMFVFLFFLFSFGGVMATFVYHLKDYFLPDAPIILFVIAVFLMGVYGIFFGLEVVGRMALIGVFSVLLLNILLIMGSLSEFDINELFPTFQSGFTNTVWASRHNNADWAMGTMMAAMVIPYVRNSKNWSRSGFVGIAIGGAFVVMWPILEVGVLSAEVAAQYFVACMQMARSAHIGLFLHRYEMIMIAFFALSSLTQIMMTLFCASIAAQRLFGAKDYRKFIIPVGLVLSSFGYWFVFDHERAMKLLETYWVYIAMIIGIGLPIMILLLGFIFKKKLGQERSAE